MKIVITGALGHIGSRFIHDLVPGEFSEVVLLDDLSTQRYASLFDLPQGVPFRFTRADILTAELERAFEGAAAVVHLAAVTDAGASFANPEEAERVNLRGTERVAFACARTGSALIALSTTSVYGVRGGVVSEDGPESELHPQTPYARSKRDAEKLLASLARSEGLRFANFRFGTIYGTSPGMRFHTAVNRFAWQAVMGEPVTVWRTALHQRRPYLHVADAARALKFAVQRGLFDNATYNAVSDNATVGEVLEALRSLVPDFEARWVDSPAMNDFSYDVSRAKLEALGFVFSGALRDGLADTVALLRNARAG